MVYPVITDLVANCYIYTAFDWQKLAGLGTIILTQDNNKFETKPNNDK